MLAVILVNVTAFATWFYHQRQAVRMEEKASCSGTCNMLTAELKLDPDQKSRVEDINRKFRDEAEPTVAEIKKIRAEMLEELSLEKADTARLSDFIARIGSLQMKLQRSAVNQFMELKQVCNADQTLKLSSIYSEVYGCPVKAKGNGKGQQHRYGKGHKDSCCEKNQ